MAWVEAVLDTLGLQDEFRGVACVCVRPKNAVDQANGAMAIRSMARNALQQPKQWKTKGLADNINAGWLRQNFLEKARNNRMDHSEFIAFSREVSMDEMLSQCLWETGKIHLSALHDPTISDAGLTAALEAHRSFTSASSMPRDWNRHCPDCGYAASCAFCRSRLHHCKTGLCNSQRFCEDCHANHPVQQRGSAAKLKTSIEKAEEALQAAKEHADVASKTYNDLLLLPMVDTPLTCPDKSREYTHHKRCLDEASLAAKTASRKVKEADQAVKEAMKSAGTV